MDFKKSGKPCRLFGNIPHFLEFSLFQHCTWTGGETYNAIATAPARLSQLIKIITTIISNISLLLILQLVVAMSPMQWILSFDYLA